MKLKIILIIIFALFGIFLLKEGITGFVISQSCCFGDNCDPECLCDVVKESPKSASSDFTFTLAGFVILTFSSIWLYKRYHN